MPLLPTPGGSRQQLAILEAANSDEGQALEKLLSTTPDAHKMLLRVLTQLECKECDARAHWEALQKHRDQLTQTLGRKAPLQLATLDYFQNLKGEIRHPKILEMSTFLETERSAISDGLTGLYNRQFFDAGLRRELKRARRYSLAFSLVMLDVDDFKSVNDRYGHVSGDEVLSLFSDVIRASVREIDVACRYGGEEFALILPETSRASAFIVSERIRIDVETLFHQQRIGVAQIDLSISGGIALYPTDADSAEELIRMADRALYSSKHDGKNKITPHADEKRQSPRLDSRKPLVFRESRHNGKSELKSQTKNLSCNGVLLESRVPFDVGTELEIDIHLPNNGADLALKGRVVRLEEDSQDTGGTRYHVGVVFLADTEEDNRRLEGFATEIYRPLVHDPRATTWIRPAKRRTLLGGMKHWEPTPPARSELGDHDVRPFGQHLAEKRVALMVSGGIAAIKAPFIARALRKQGADVIAYCSKEALRYTTEDALEWSTTNPVVTRLTASAEHLNDASSFDGYLLAPATYNTINKVATGIADGVLTATLAAALGRMERGDTKVLIAATMHGDMHTSILTESLRKLQGMGTRVILPREDYGKHNIPDTRTLVAEVCAELSTSPLKGRRILVTGGPTPVPIDNVRIITSRFTGKLGTAIADELTLRGADVKFILGKTGLTPPSYIDCTRARTFDEYRAAVLDTLAADEYDAGIFSAAVADYKPQEVTEGKIPSGGALKSIPLTPTEKVIDLVREKFPKTAMVSFKYQENLTHDELMAIANDRLARGHLAVVANRGEETGPGGEQIAYIVSEGAEPKRFQDKPEIAAGIADFLEKKLG